MTVWDWFGQQSFHHQDFSGLFTPGGLGPAEDGKAGRVVAAGVSRAAAEAVRLPSVTLIMPARDVAGTIGPILDTVAGLNERTG